MPDPKPPYNPQFKFSDIQDIVSPQAQEYLQGRTDEMVQPYGPLSDLMSASKDAGYAPFDLKTQMPEISLGDPADDGRIFAAAEEMLWQIEDPDEREVFMDMMMKSLPSGSNMEDKPLQMHFLKQMMKAQEQKLYGDRGIGPAPTPTMVPPTPTPEPTLTAIEELKRQQEERERIKRDAGI